MSQLTLTTQQQQALIAAGQRIAPSWPLDQMIAVNPWWEMRDQPLQQVAAKLSALTSTNVLMPSEYYASLWQRSSISSQHLSQAAAELHYRGSEASLLKALQQTPELNHWHNISDWLDAGRDQQHEVAWRDEITHQISQFCAARYQDDGAVPASDNLYRDWLNVTLKDRGIAILMASSDLMDAFKALPQDYEQLLAEAIQVLQLDDDILSDYGHALLLDINGWASWLAYERWQTRLDDEEQDDLPQLLAIRLAWELVLWRYHTERQPQQVRQWQHQWRQQLTLLPTLLQQHQQALEPMWVWQRAAELAYQQHLQQQLQQPQSWQAREHRERPVVQAAFCIDVRSEVIRRALEAQHNGIETLGFAGFFGLPLEYAPAGGHSVRPQLPGLLRAAIRVTEAGPDGQALGERRQQAQVGGLRFQQWGSSASSSFSMVESAGWWSLFKLLKNSFWPAAGDYHALNALEPGNGPWLLSKGERPLTLAEKVELAHGILGAMGLTRFAPTVLLVGHGSHSRNNPHAAGLDCGACGGQTGEVNVRVLARLLNDQTIRIELRQLGHDIGDDVVFIAALHNTTTDDITLFDATAEADLAGWLQAAKQQAQQERAQALGLNNDAQLDANIRQRSQDWSEVRPEWGLAGNGAFIVAPRARTRALDLQGRVFLHDYHWQQDQDFSVLELIMTAPMVVTHWINMQYNASVTDNLKYGSGNKVLHNVVGGHLGVFEGNGGDLRIGLSLQSLHDGQQWMHQPLRISVYIDAPRDAIADIVQRHQHVRQLIDNDWLFLFRLGEHGSVERYYQQQWLAQTEQQRGAA
ncbi:DUF2309 domain-containing protein [Bacterioplanes sanyensis]|uniref:Probable inorganic carbon transporter subunit DabA n=1 Tax=Bacterioplanes sanyensis TaxID=1249553 RepID=A0A222FI99_9GAMM|nr:DUF2309 domain-containing protein [Bacterioplanes sanyensis]ASP37943.1 DUF2309 domain-containing protein [Bacterioplanes sanyensis]